MHMSTVLPADLEFLLKGKIKNFILNELSTGWPLQTRAILRAKIEERISAKIDSLAPNLSEEQKPLAINDVWMLILAVVDEMTEAGDINQWKVSNGTESFFYISLPDTMISPFKRDGGANGARFPLLKRLLSHLQTTLKHD